jgi:hypothetical protein
MRSSSASGGYARTAIEIGVAIRTSKTTRHIPLVYVGGVAVKVEKVRTLLPDVTYTEWEDFGAAVLRAIGNQPDEPIVLTSMSGSKPLVAKLGVRRAPGSGFSTRWTALKRCWHRYRRGQPSAPYETTIRSCSGSLRRDRTSKPPFRQ